MLLIFLVFCVVFFSEIRVAHLFSFQCCVVVFCLFLSCFMCAQYCSVSGFFILDCPLQFSQTFI